MEIEKDFDYPTRKEENESLNNLYNFMDKNYPYIGGIVCGVRLTDFSYRKKVDYNGNASMNPMDNMNLQKFKSDLHQKIETVPTKTQNVDNLYKSLNKTIDSKVNRVHFMEDKTIKNFYNLPKMDDLEFQNTPLMQADALKMSDKTMMKKNWRYQEKLGKGEVDDNDPYSAFKKGEEDDYEENRKKLISSLNMSSHSTPVEMDVDDDDDDSLSTKTNQTSASSHASSTTIVSKPFKTTQLFDETNTLRKTALDRQLEQELEEFAQRPKKAKKSRKLVPIPLNEEDVPKEKKSMKKPTKSTESGKTAENIELEKEAARYSKYHSDMIRKGIDYTEASVKARSKPLRDMSQINTLESDITAEDIEDVQKKHIEKRNLLKVPTASKQIDIIRDDADLQNVLNMMTAGSTEENADEIPKGQRNISNIQAQAKEYVSFYKKNLNEDLYKNHLFDRHGTQIFNKIFELFNEPLLDKNEKLVDAYKRIKPYLSKKRMFV